MAAALIAMIGATLATLAGPWLIRSLLRSIEESIQVDQTLAARRVVTTSAALLLVYALRPALRALQTWSTHVAGWGSVAEARQKLYEHLQTLSPRYYTATQTGQIMSRVVNDTAHFEALIAHAIPEITVSILTVVGVFAVLFSINGRLALYTLIPIPLIIIGFIMYNRHVRPLFRQAQAKLGDLNSTLQDNLSGMREIQVFTQEEREKQRIETRVVSHAKAITRAVSISACFHGGIDFFTGIGTVAVALFGGLMALKDRKPIK